VFVQTLQSLGWTTGRNVQIDIRWGATDAASSRRYAAEMVALAPDVILTGASAATAAVQEATRTLPIVFVNVTDPVGAGYVASLARPGGNITGFTFVEYGMSGKEPSIAASIGQFAVIQSVAPSLGVDVRPVNVMARSEVERTVSAFAKPPNGGLIITAGAITFRDREFIAALAARQKLPSVAPYRFFVSSGGLISYGVDFTGQFRRAAGYVDRILKGDKPADLPVQAPNKYELVINLKTAKALGLDVPPTLLSRADEVIE
jgi:ABC-type uncharacterized transport system substrate-binding protein